MVLQGLKFVSLLGVASVRAQTPPLNTLYLDKRVRKKNGEFLIRDFRADHERGVYLLLAFAIGLESVK